MTYGDIPTFRGLTAIKHLKSNNGEIASLRKGSWKSHTKHGFFRGRGFVLTSVVFNFRIVLNQSID